MSAFVDSLLVLFVLLNPFIMSVYLIGHVRALDLRAFSQQLVSAGLIAYVIFIVFSWGGDAIFRDVLNVRFAAFQVFGGITFLIIGTRLILGVGPPFDAIPPDTESRSGSIAMPYIVGPGTISASVLTGSRLELTMAMLVIGAALSLAVGSMLVIKVIHDFVRKKNEEWVKRYVEIAGRVTALFTGSFAIEMILTGVQRWFSET